MFKRNLWKLTLSFAVVLYAVLTLIPLQDRDFSETAKDAVKYKTAEFSALLKEAGDRRAAHPKESPSVFVGLKQISKERKIKTLYPIPNYRPFHLYHRSLHLSTHPNTRIKVCASSQRKSTTGH